MYFKQKFEPKEGVIHGVGQSSEQFKKYWNAVENNKPLIYMAYIRINEIKQKFQNKVNDAKKISSNLMLQIGLNLKAKEIGNQCKQIIKGIYDEELFNLIKIIKDYKNPVFLRIGYEFNEPNKYKPKEFILAWKHIIDLFRNKNIRNVAFVWCSCTAFNENIKEIMKFYPGDNYVDWFGNDLFGVQHFKDNADKISEDFAKEAEKHKKPLMICESSAIKSGVNDGKKSWDAWFKPFFKWIKEHPIVKAFCYINWNWAIDWKTPEWGNCRIEENEIVRKSYIRELSKKIYIHNKSKKLLSPYNS